MFCTVLLILNGEVINHQKSITSIDIMFANGIVGYKTKYQDKFVTACDTTKLVLFFWSILDDLGIPHDQATIIYEDNTSALLMAKAQQPTWRTHHLEINHFSLLDLIEWDLLVLKSISTTDNAANAFTKPLSKQLFLLSLWYIHGTMNTESIIESINEATKECLSSFFSACREDGGVVIDTPVDIV